MLLAPSRRARVLSLAGPLLAGGLVCALECRYHPSGGDDALWVTLALDGGAVRRVRSPRDQPRLEATRQLDRGGHRT